MGLTGKTKSTKATKMTLGLDYDVNVVAYLAPQSHTSTHTVMHSHPPTYPHKHCTFFL